MNFRETFALAVAASLVFLLVSASAAEPGPFGDRPRHRSIVNPCPLGFWLELGLTEAQKDKIQKTITTYRQEQRDYRDRWIEARTSLREQLHSDPFDEEALREASRRAAQIREEMVVLRGKMLAEYRGILTPEQLDLLAQQKAKVKRGHKHCYALPQVERR